MIDKAFESTMAKMDELVEDRYTAEFRLAECEALKSNGVTWSDRSFTVEMRIKADRSILTSIKADIQRLATGVEQ